MFFLCVFLCTDDNIVKMAHVHTDPQKQLNAVSQVVGDVTL